MGDALYDRLHAAMEKTQGIARTSAEHVLAAAFAGGAFPRAVIDFGCGRGDWLRTARTLGATHVLGIDPFGDELKDAGFARVHHDLTRPWDGDAPFDVAICVEVGEHLPASAAATLVGSIARAAPRCVFSAAVPGQGGLEHKNEQPPEYWAQEFRRVGMACFDCRARFWNDADIEPWYRQNLLFFARESDAPASWLPFRVDDPRHLVHPEIFHARRTGADDNVIWEYVDRTWRAVPLSDLSK